MLELRDTPVEPRRRKRRREWWIVGGVLVARSPALPIGTPRSTVLTSAGTTDAGPESVHATREGGVVVIGTDYRSEGYKKAKSEAEKPAESAGKPDDSAKKSADAKSGAKPAEKPKRKKQSGGSD